MKRILIILAIMVSMLAKSVFAQENTPQDTKSSDNIVFQGNKTSTPQYPGGEEEMQKFIDENMVFPQSAIDKNISGRVILRFFVDTEGNIKGITVQQGLDADCNNAAIECIKKMPKWLPAQQNGRSITSAVTVPVVFKTKQVVYEYAPSDEEIDYEQYNLANKKWTLVEISGKEIPENVPGMPYFTLTIEKKRKILGGNASCADFTGIYSWNEKNWTLKFNKIELAKKKCKSKKIKVIDGDFISLLKSTTQYRVEDGKLTIGKIVRDRFTPIAVFEYEILKEKGKKK
ncbi:MAG: TonB family protein [Prevotellaceae bacterium]|jgi:TonB family protein|nr:TonB family protein [Prevotellaceae bacterium]